VVRRNDSRGVYWWLVMWQNGVDGLLIRVSITTFTPALLMTNCGDVALAVYGCQSELEGEYETYVASDWRTTRPC
jgi:hypothetical protein